jgi:hypothetical protein
MARSNSTAFAVAAVLGSAKSFAVDYAYITDADTNIVSVIPHNRGAWRVDAVEPIGIPPRRLVTNTREGFQT